MVALADVRRWNSDGIEAAFRGVRTARDHLLDLDADLHGARPPAEWTGAAGDVARAAHTTLTEQLGRVTISTDTARPALADASDAVVALHRDLDRADALAADLGFFIAPDGTVTDIRQIVVATDQVDAYRRRRTGEQNEILDALGRVLRDAEQIDNTLADRIHQAIGHLDDGTGNTATGTDAPAPPPGATPAGNAAYWAGLTAAQQEQVLRDHPDWIGNLDGVPGTARDRANRARLGTELARIDADMAAALAEIDRIQNADLPPWVSREGDPQAQAPFLDRLSALQTQRDALTAITTTLDKGGRQLLALDTTGEHVTAAVAIGNVDTADHVAVLTPGLGTTVESSLGDYDDALFGLKTDAERQADLLGTGPTVATVSWLGYEAPQISTDLITPSRSVFADEAAQRGAERLTGFYQGLSAARSDEFHLTALGHSYGSLTTGLALQHDTGVDDAVFFGSPGIGTNDITDLHVPAGHTYVAEADGDIVADAATFGPDPNQLDGVTVLSTADSTDPSTNAPLHANSGHTATGNLTTPVYLGENTTARYNFANIIAGAGPDKLRTGDDWGPIDYLNAPFS